MIIKAVLLVAIELIIYWLVGTLADGFITGSKRSNACMRTAKGFLCYQILFQICALPMILLERSLTELTGCWCVLLLVVVIAAILLRRKQIRKDVDAVIAVIKSQPLYCLAGIVAIVALCYYVSVNGVLDEDSLYYIGLVNTTLETDTMFQYNVYTGVYMPSLYLRRILVTFEIEAAVLAKVFRIEPILVMRLFRSCVNVILSAITIYSIGGFVYKDYEPENRRKKSIVFAILALYANFLMDNTIFMNATFLLHRAYEGKAYAANTLILCLIFLCIETIIEKKKRNYIWLGVLMWASAAISTSAIIVNLAAISVWVIANVLVYVIAKKQKKTEREHAGS